MKAEPTGKQATSGKRGETCNGYFSVHGKHATSIKHGMQPVVRTGKHATVTKRGKTNNENIQHLPSVGKHTTGAKKGKICTRCQARENIKLVLRNSYRIIKSF